MHPKNFRVQIFAYQLHADFIVNCMDAPTDIENAWIAWMQNGGDTPEGNPAYGNPCAGNYPCWANDSTGVSTFYNEDYPFGRAEFTRFRFRLGVPEGGVNFGARPSGRTEVPEGTLGISQAIPHSGDIFGHGQIVPEPIEIWNPQCEGTCVYGCGPVITQGVCDCVGNCIPTDENLYPDLTAGGNFSCEVCQDSSADMIAGCMDPSASNYSESYTIPCENSDLCNECTYIDLADVNADGVINVVDIVSMVNCILDDNCPPYPDPTGDGFINVVDIIFIVNTILRSSFTMSHSDQQQILSLLQQLMDSDIITDTEKTQIHQLMGQVRRRPASDQPYEEQ